MPSSCLTPLRQLPAKCWPSTRFVEKSLHKTRIARIAASAAVLVLWCVFIFYMSALVGDESEGISDGICFRISHFLASFFTSENTDLLAEQLSHPVRKTAHFCEYTLLGALFLNLLYQIAPNKLGRTLVVGAWAFATLYAATDEFHQLFVEGRSGQVSDVCLDSVGVLFGIAVLYAVLHTMEKRQAHANQS